MLKQAGGSQVGIFDILDCDRLSFRIGAFAKDDFFDPPGVWIYFPKVDRVRAVYTLSQFGSDYDF